MFRVILSFILTMFLFVGLIGTASVLFKSQNKSENNIIAEFSENPDSRLTIKEIESITASSNFTFTSVNALR